jgi:hypothetical protein
MQGDPAVHAAVAADNRLERLALAINDCNPAWRWIVIFHSTHGNLDHDTSAVPLANT